MKYRYSKYLDGALFLVDLSALNSSLLLGYFIYYQKLGGFNLYPNIEVVWFSNLAWLVLTILGKPYQIPRTSRASFVVRHIFRFVIIHLLALSGLLVLRQDVFPPRDYIIYSYILFSLSIVLVRLLYLYFIRIYRKYGFNYRNVAVVGHGEVAEELKKFFRLHPEFGYRFLGFFDAHKSDRPITGNMSDLIDRIANNRLDELYCCLPNLQYNEIQDLIQLGEKNYIKVKLIADFRGFEYKGLQIETYENIPVLNVTSFPLDEVKNRVIKRSFDIAFSLIIIISVLSWLLPLISLIICIDSRGPVFFKQKRTGKGNSDFWCWKFRTMYINGDSDFRQAKPNDDRVTRVGSILRRTSLDELPQFFNVLLGNMSVVGPRPHMLHHTREYSQKVERFMARHFVKPGITGLAQAKGYRGETPHVSYMKNRVKFDRFYIENWSLFLDLKIILLTATTFVKGDKNAI
ncbi:MAG: undecaprenyl-phosphate glucose phosphotransferase [Bacteroidota bacterium]